MKTILVAGVPRSGKTLLAKRICKATGRSHLPGDALVSSFARLYPELGISHDLAVHDNVCRSVQPLLEQLVKHYRYEGVSLVLDVFHVTPAWLSAQQEHCTSVVLGYPRTDVGEKVEAIRTHQRSGDWTASLSTRELADLVEAYSARSRMQEQECAALNLPFVDCDAGFEPSLRKAETRVLSRSGDRAAAEDVDKER